MSGTAPSTLEWTRWEWGLRNTGEAGSRPASSKLSPYFGSVSRWPTLERTKTFSADVTLNPTGNPDSAVVGKGHRQSVRNRREREPQEIGASERARRKKGGPGFLFQPRESGPFKFGRAPPPTARTNGKDLNGGPRACALFCPKFHHTLH